MPKDSLYMVGRREGSMMAVDCLCHRYKLEWIRPKIRYSLFCWWFNIYCNSSFGRRLYIIMSMRCMR